MSAATPRRWRRMSKRALIDIVAEHGARTPEEAVAFVSRPEEDRTLSAGRLLRMRIDDRTSHSSRSAAAAHGNRWRGCRCSWRSKASAPWSPAVLPAAAWKAELLSAAGATVDVYARRRRARSCSRVAARSAARHYHDLSARDLGRTISLMRRSRSAPVDDDDEAARSPRGARRAACRSTSSTSRHFATSRSAPSSTARRW